MLCVTALQSEFLTLAEVSAGIGPGFEEAKSNLTKTDCPQILWLLIVF